MERQPIPDALLAEGRIPEMAAPPEVDHITEGLVEMQKSGFTQEQAYTLGSLVVYMDDRCKGTIAEAFSRHAVIRQGMMSAADTARAANADVEAAAIASFGFFLKRDPETNEPIREDLIERIKKNRPQTGR